MAEYKHHRPVLDQDVKEFQVVDLFMSRTDKRAVIRSANPTFRRLAGFEWDELIGAPHKIIRHPDMPRGVFHLFWERLNAGKPVGAYVKNLAKDGRYYWVYAIAMPVEGGYVSVRLKPTSPILDNVKAAYKMLLARERTEGLEPAASADILREHLRGEGFGSYREVMAISIRSEVSARRHALGRKIDPAMKGLEELKKAVDAIGADLDAVREMFESIRGTPTNLRIQATRFGDMGVPIQVISQNYDLLTKEIEAMNRAMSDVYEDMAAVLDEDSFALSAVALLHEAFVRFKNQTDLPDGICMSKEVELIAPHAESFRARGDVLLQRTETLVKCVRQLQRIVSGLAVTRVMCRIEAAGLTGESGGIAEIINRLLTFQTGVMESIERIEGTCRHAYRTMEHLVMLFNQPLEEQIPQEDAERRRFVRGDTAAA